MISLTKRYWEHPEVLIATDEEKRLAKQFKVVPELIRLLRNRGMHGEDEMRKFLFPTLHDLVDPFLMKGMDAACRVIHEALAEKKTILIWGDYDVDGVTGTTLLVSFLREIGGRVEWYIPHRYDDGYGLNVHKLREILEGDPRDEYVIITVDCGIAENDAIRSIKERNCTVIVTDHHEPGDDLPCADVIINPKQPGCRFPCNYIAGVGIAFYLCVGLRSQLASSSYRFPGTHPPSLKKYLELVAIGTIADMVPVTGLNRVLVKGGFEVIRENPGTGVQALLKLCDIHSGDISSEDIAFQIAPRINAAGRLADGSLAVRLLLEGDEKTASIIARKLDSLNNQRKEICREYLDITLTDAEGQAAMKNPIIVLQTECPLGVVGIVASQLMNTFTRPVVLLARVEDPEYGMVLKGSCRSVAWIDIHAVLSQCSDLLLQYGGHAAAAGVTLRPEMFEDFTSRIQSVVESEQTCKHSYETVDLQLSIEDAVSDQVAGNLSLLEPCGVGNAKPRFMDRKVIIQQIRHIGKDGNHISFEKRGRFSQQRCIAFNLAQIENKLRQKQEFDLVYEISLHRFRQKISHQPRIIDVI